MLAHVSSADRPRLPPAAVLMQKMARDRFRRAMQDKKNQVNVPQSQVCGVAVRWGGVWVDVDGGAESRFIVAQSEEVKLCSQLMGALQAAKGDKRAEGVIWDEQWRTVYALAEATMSRTLDQF